MDTHNPAAGASTGKGETKETVVMDTGCNVKRKLFDMEFYSGQMQQGDVVFSTFKRHYIIPLIPR